MTLISLDQARELLLGDVRVLGSECVPLGETVGRILATPIIASHTQPAEPRATMDGIVVTDVDPATGQEWNLVGDIPAGTQASAPLCPGEAVRIATGGVLPAGGQRVLPQELLSFSAHRVQLKQTQGTALFVRPRGADFNLGDRLLEPGCVVGPGQLGLIAAANLSSAEVARRPRVSICVSGDELVAPGSVLSEGQSVDSASYALAALVRSWGGTPQVHPILPDELDSIQTTLGNALETCDVLLCVGGASVGARDLMRPAAAALGAKFLFERIAVQPGKPCWHARVGPVGLILGLPGNPTSAFVCAHLLLWPLISKLLNGTRRVPFRTAFSATSLPANGAREQFLRAGGSYDEEGRLWATQLPDQDSGLQATLAQAQLLIRRAPNAEALDRGAPIEAMELTAAITA